MNKLLHIKVFTFNYNAPILNMIYSQFVFQISLICSVATVSLTRRYSDKWLSQKINDPQAVKW